MAPRRKPFPSGTNYRGEDPLVVIECLATSFLAWDPDSWSFAELLSANANGNLRRACLNVLTKAVGILADRDEKFPSFASFEAFEREHRNSSAHVVRLVWTGIVLAAEDDLCLPVQFDAKNEVHPAYDLFWAYDPPASSRYSPPWRSCETLS